MNISRVFIARPIATGLVMLAILIFGAMAYLRLPVAALPDVDFPTIQVSAQLPGASAETMASSVATQLERQFSTIDGVTSMSSESTLGSTNITLQFDLARDLDSAALDVQSAISRSQPRMPRDMPSPPSFRKVNPADQAILLLSLSSPTLPLYAVDEFAQTRLAQTISQVRGVAQVQVFGSQKYAVRLQIDPQRLAALGIGLDQVSTAVQNANVHLPTGALYGPHKAFAIEADGQLTNAAAYTDLVVAYENGSAVRLRDLGRAIDGVETDKTAAWIGSRAGAARAVVLAVQKQPGANTVEVARKVRELLPSFRKDIPGSVDLDVLFDRSQTVKESVRDVEFTLGLTLALVVGVIFVFLRRARATLIPSLSMPLAIFATFAAMYLLGFSLNNLSLMAITLSVGFVVDDAIVMLENVVRHVEMGKPPLRAAYDASREIGFTIVSMTLSLAAVFIPFLFMGGVLGSLFKEFAVSIAVSILVSGFVSLSLTPMLSARMLERSGERRRRGWFFQTVEIVLGAVLRGYDRTLLVALRRRRSVLVLSLAILAATVLLFLRAPKGFLPIEDTDQLSITTEALQGTSFEALVARQQQVAEIVGRHPDVDAYMSNAGPRGSRTGTNQGSLFVRLKSRRDRTHDAQEIAADLSRRLARVPGLQSFITIPPPIRLGGRTTKSEYQLTLSSSDTAVLFREAPRLAQELAKLDALSDVTSDVQLDNPEIAVKLDREQAAALGISAARVEDTLYTAYGSRQISTIYSSNNSYAVILELLPETQRDPQALSALHVRADSGALAPLGAVAKLEQGVGPLSVNHSGQLPSATVSFNVRRGHALGDAVDAVEATARRVLPSSVSMGFQGSAEAFQSSLSGLGSLLAVAVFVIYVVLGILYESLIHPLTILSALPFAGFGAVATLWVFGVDLDVYAFVGIILLVGLVKKNGIMMIDFAIEARKDAAVSAEHAIHRACVVRFRPIMMTTMAALLGTLPIALGLGAGAESRRPLGLAVVGGLLFSQLLTLYVTPVFYVYFERLREWRSMSTRGASSEPRPAPAE